MIAIQKAADGKTVSIVSSGDAGVYGMAGLALELAQETLKRDNLKIEIIAGVSAANAASAKLGAPLMLDYANISLSDLLVSWKLIREKLEAAASADFVVAIFNPKSKKREWQLKEAAEIFRKHRPGITPVGVCTNVGYAAEEKTVLTDLDHFLEEDIGMKTMVIVGNRATRRMGNWIVTPRGYKGKRF